MATLGELMAGIVHEIQNPLNFINNFSEVTVELFEDLCNEQAAGNEKLVKELQAEIFHNLQKINLHGKRAASIVKGMLQHSRVNSGKKEPTDINELTEECIQLTNQGLRDKPFQLKLTRNYAKDLPIIPVVPQDIGRVIINLVSNAIYSVKEKKLQSTEDFQPEVTISTLLNSNKVNIKIKDNGKGIAPKVADKIFQPFFTTKPSGQGTGLGLSLSYEIIKAHEGELTISSEEGKFAEFTIQLPV
jgi:signal transduction histidine kinase